jgi:hypothetical protein
MNGAVVADGTGRSRRAVCRRRRWRGHACRNGNEGAIPTGHVPRALGRAWLAAGALRAGRGCRASWAHAPLLETPKDPRGPFSLAPDDTVARPMSDGSGATSSRPAGRPGGP